MMDYESRVQPSFSSESSKNVPLQALPMEIHDFIDPPENGLVDSPFDYDLLLYLLMNNHMPFNRAIPVPSCVSPATPQYGTFQNPVPPVACAIQHSYHAASPPGWSHYQPTNQMSRANDPSWNYLTKQALEAFNNDTDSTEAEQDSYFGPFDDGFGQGSSRDSFSTDNSFPSVSSAPAACYYPRSAPEIDPMAAQPQIGQPPKHCSTQCRSHQPQFVSHEGEMSGMSPGEKAAAPRQGTAIKTEEPFHSSESFHASEPFHALEPQSEAPAVAHDIPPKTQAANKANNAPPSIKAEEPLSPLPKAPDTEGEKRRSDLPIECLSPLDRWKLHCHKFQKPKIKKGPIQCPHCSEAFQSIAQCVEHLDQEGFKQKNICPDDTCPFSILGFKVRNLLRRHICNEHLKRYNQKKMRCKRGRRKDPPEVKSFLHLVYVCEHKECRRAFYRSDSLVRHGRLTHHAKDAVMTPEGSDTTHAP